MTDICFQCRFEFLETSIQYNRRIKNNTPKICRECYRIENAEKRAEKRAEKKDHREQVTDESRMSIALLYSDREDLSRCFIQMKHKLSSEESSEVVLLHSSLK